MSERVASIESMFERLCSLVTDSGIVAPDDVGDVGPDRLAELIAVTQRLESVLVARRLAAVEALLWHRIVPEDVDPAKQYDFVDGVHKTCAEVSALLDVSAMAASYMVHYAQVLGERLPKVAAVLASGHTNWPTVQLIINRTDLVIDSDLVARLDETLAIRLLRWGSWSRRRILTAVDALVIAIDPDAAKQRRERDALDRYVEIGAQPNGMAALRGNVCAAEAIVFDRKLSELAAGVCADDPRTLAQRRADALAALSTGRGLACRCGQPDCPAGENNSGG